MILKSTLSALFLIISISVYAQWSGSQGNEWIDYNQSYLRVNISEKGLYKIPFSNLPEGFSKDAASFQLWHRGKEVSIISVENNEILFFAVPNDGSSDSLLFRPYTARLNPYLSFFSDKSSYFLTSKGNGKRAVTVETVPVSGTSEPYHFQTDITTFKNQFSFSTLTPSPLVFNNSFYENINSWTGGTMYGPKAVGYNGSNGIFKSTYVLRNLVQDLNEKPMLRMMVQGMHHGTHLLKTYAGKSSDAKDLTEISSLDFTGLGGKAMGPVPLIGSLTDNGSGVLSVKSISDDMYDWFSVSYYTLSYPQSIQMDENKSAYFHFKSTINKISRVNIKNAPNTVQIFDITDIDAPRKINAVLSANSAEFMIPRESGKELTLLASVPSDIKTISSDKIFKVNFNAVYSKTSVSGSSNIIKPSAYDYLIIASDTLLPAALEYAKYRSSVEGGDYNTLVMDMRNIYDQFNYGEASPVGIKRFVDYMVKDGVRDKHNLLLVGISVTAPDSAQLRLKKDLPHEVPTIGDPGADILLVSGVGKLSENFPAIPVGRISAFNRQQVLDYLEKVKAFEADNSEKEWQKNILHLNGGKSANEISQLSTILRNLTPLVKAGELGGNVKAFVKQTTIEVENVDISKDVNDGVGMITYFGHGDPFLTDLNMGKVTDASRNYKNIGKFPLMYFNGCGVGNVFSGRSVLTLSADWILAKERGAIAAVSNSYNSYVSPTSKHIKILYEELFTSSQSRSIGQILRTVATRIVSSSPDSYDIANLNQANLQGDPAVKLFNVISPDYAFNTNDIPLRLVSEDGKAIGISSKLNLEIVISNYGKYLKNKSIPLVINYYSNSSLLETKAININAVAYKDTISFSFPNNKNITKIEVRIDPNNTVTETEKNNNVTELYIDWDVARELVRYPDYNNSDIVAPLLKVTFNNRFIKNEEQLMPNPILKVRLQDNSLLTTDRALFDIYIKSCWGDGCEFKKLDLTNKDVKINTVSSHVIELSYLPDNLPLGQYELLINGRDVAGNEIANLYEIRFEIVSESNTLSLFVSPNPASDYVRFTANVSGLKDVESLLCTIYNSQGTVVKVIETKSPFNGENEWYWIPNGAMSGLYLYKLEIREKTKSVTTLNGKFVLL